MSNIIHPDTNIVNSDRILSPERSETKSKGLKTKFYPSISSGNKILPKIIFLGTPDFALPALEKLAQSKYKPVAVFCAPDKPVGRKQTLTPPPVKITAQKYNIPIFQPANSHELAETIKSTPCDIIITTAYGLILPKEVLDAPQYDCLNIHPSLLPKYRGASPIQSAILNGDTETGVTIYKMDEQIDHGAIIAQIPYSLSEVEGSKKDTTPELSDRLSNISANLLLKTLPDWFAGKITPQPQNDSQATLTKIITKENGQINWQKSALEIERQIRAYTPWPSAYANLKIKNENIKIKILEADTSDDFSGKQTGEVFLTDANDLAAQTGHGALIIKKLQLASGKTLSAADFLRGHKEIINKILN